MAVDSSKKVGKLGYEISSREFKVRVDVEEKLGGENTAPDPHDYLQIALAGCTAITVQMYANRKGIPLESADVKIKITSEGAENVILREIHLVGTLTYEQQQSLLVIAEKCPIHKFLVAGAKIDTKLI